MLESSMLLKHWFFVVVASSVVDRRCFDADPDSTFHFVAVLKAGAKKSMIRIRNPEYGSKDPVLDPYQNVRDPERWNFKFLVFLFL
jgi:hypothetical protein